MKKIILASLLLLAFSVAAPSVMAQGITNPAIRSLGDNPEAAASGSTFQQYFILLWQALISVGGLMVLVYFLWGGIEWITAAGDSGKVQKARDRMTQAIIGLVILVGSFAIITWISRIFFGNDFNILRLQFGSAGPSQQMQDAQQSADDALDTINNTIDDRMPF